MMGSIIGAIIGYVVFGWFGALIGGIIGSRIDRRRHYFHNNYRRDHGPHTGGGFGGFGGFGAFSGMRTQYMQRQDMYFKIFFSILGKMAKADGVITKAEGDYVVTLLSKMNIHGQLRNSAIDYFNNAKHSNETINEMAQSFANMCGGQPQLLRQLLYQVVGVAAADGKVSTKEMTILQSLCRIFGISETELRQYIQTYGSSTDHSYEVLGVSSNATHAELKKAYRQKIKEYHPDVLKSKGLPESFIKDAQKRFFEIQEAWRTIKKERNIHE